MKKYILILISICFGLNGLAQNKTYLGLYVSPESAYRQLHNNGNPMYNPLVDRRDYSEIGIFALDAGLTLAYKPNSKVFLQTGLAYQSFGYKTVFNTLLFEGQIDAQFGFIGTNFFGGEVKDIFHYVKIPLNAMYRFGKEEKNLHFFTGLSCDLGYLVNAQQKSFFGGTRVVDSYTTSYNRFNLLSGISAGLDLELENEIIMRWEVKGTYGLLPIIDASVTGYLHSVGFKTTVLAPLKNLSF